MKKLMVILTLCFSFLIFGFSPVSAVENLSNVETHVLDDGAVVTKSISPRGMETFTITRDDGIRDYGFVRWHVTLTYNPSARTYTFVNISYENHFNSSVPTYRVYSYTTTPKVGSDVTNVNIIRIDYQIATIGSHNIHWDFNFDI